ncbi:tRNA methyltransferase 10 homolog C-like [Pecten maximus]|uniref:tRNA methyltransferase 10 homolog C-like n=1 Tax=Pecten maximus TaxID=6579 RepID=UPI00145808B0|nr:tRNA methyltransferase 10 homolog C-like [Pecten maximus]XP_033745279.1 tRNA methyltransferase 10 homolog C-like [Pecten maximus]XP_033745280.1 tRNA methyltransferase 10 homolog C-like [Pecten maximus]
MPLIVGLRCFIRPVSSIWKCFPAVNHAIGYNVKTTPVRVSLYQNYSSQRSPEALKVVTNEEENGRVDQESFKDNSHPVSLPPPSKELLDSLSDAQMKHYKDIVYAYENHWRFKDIMVPAAMTDANWKKLLGSGKKNIGKILSGIHHRTERKRLKKENKEPKARDENTVHGISVPKEKIRKTYTILNTYRSMEYGPELVYDLGFKSDASPSHIFREESRIRRQLMETIHTNSKQRFPFHLVFCNVNERSRSMLEEVAADVPITITDRGYLDMFDRCELVYLSPDSPEELETFDHNHVYIVGCITDLETKPFTKLKAQKHGIKHKKFPIKRYLGNTTTSLLTLNQVCNVLYDLKDTDNWRRALRHVPERFQKTQDNKPRSQQKHFKKFKS